MIFDIMQKPEGWNEEVLKLANDLLQMNTTYANFAASFSHKLFTNQAKLGLDPADVVAALTEVATILGVIELNTERAMQIVISNQAVPERGAVPVEDSI